MGYKIAGAEVDCSAIIEHIIDIYDAQNTVRNGKRNPEKYDKYCQTLKKLGSFLECGRGKATVDSPDSQLSTHSVLINLKNDEFNSPSEINAFTDLLKSFDGFMFVGDSSGNISISCITNNVWVEQ